MKFTKEHTERHFIDYIFKKLKLIPVLYTISEHNTRLKLKKRNSLIRIKKLLDSTIYPSKHDKVLINHINDSEIHSWLDVCYNFSFITFHT